MHRRRCAPSRAARASTAADRSSVASRCASTGSRRPRSVVHALARQAELLQRLRPELQHDRLDVGDEAGALRELEIAAVRKRCHLCALRAGGARRTPGSRCRLPTASGSARRRATSCRPRPRNPREEPDARRTLVADDEVLVVAELRLAVGLRERREVQPAREIDEHVLPRSHVAVGLDHRMADRVGRRIGFRDRTVEQADRVVALEIRRVGQDEIGERDRLGPERIASRRRTGSGSRRRRPSRAGSRACARCSSPSSTPCSP